MTGKDCSFDGFDFRLQLLDLHQDQFGAGPGRLRKFRALGEGLELRNAPDSFGSDQTKLGKLPRDELTSMVRWRTNRSRVRCSIRIDCCSALLTGTNRIVGLVTASQIASASTSSFLPRLT